MARLKQFYFDTVVKELKKKFDYSSTMQVPRITKITLNMGVGEAVADKKVMDNAVEDMEKIAGQKPVVTLSKKSIAAFKIRDNYPVGCKVTLRKSNMYTFLDRYSNDRTRRAALIGLIVVSAFIVSENSSNGLSFKIKIWKHDYYPQ